jgi:hypothetical protein
MPNLYACFWLYIMKNFTSCRSRSITWSFCPGCTSSFSLSPAWLFVSDVYSLGLASFVSFIVSVFTLFWKVFGCSACLFRVCAKRSHSSFFSSKNFQVFLYQYQPIKVESFWTVFTDFP